MTKKSAKPSAYVKDFVGWAKFAKELENRPRPTNLKSGIICWCYLGVNVGTEQDGTGENFARPALILDLLGPNQAFILPFTSRIKKGRSYMQVMVKGNPETLIINQPRAIDMKRLGYYLDEVNDEQLQNIRRIVANLILNPPQAKWQDSE